MAGRLTVVSVIILIVLVASSSTCTARISERIEAPRCSHKDVITVSPTQTYNSLLESWGNDAIRIRISPDSIIDVPYQALLPQPPNSTTSCYAHTDATAVTNGNLIVTIGTDGTVTATRISDNTVLIKTSAYSFTKFAPQTVFPQDYTLYTTTLNYTHNHGFVYGLGEHQYQADRTELPYTNFQHNFADSEVYGKSRGGDVMIPYYSSTAGFSLLVNNAGWGYIDIGSDKAYWVSSAVHQIDLWITTIPPTYTTPTFWPILSQNWAEVTGYYNPMPYWATGFIQSKDRYRTQDEILNVAKNYYNRSIQVSMIVIDYLHWAHLGDWRFVAECWPNPTQMIQELTAMDMRAMVSVWPQIEPASTNFAHMNHSGFFSKTAMNQSAPESGVFILDTFNPDATRFLFEQLQIGYRQYGIKLFWLDESEPDFSVPGTQWYNGHSDWEVNNLWSVMHAKGIYENSRLSGMQSDEILILSRSTWIGAQHYNVLHWSGDTLNTFDALYHQILISQNSAITGDIWWTSDAGGYINGDLTDPIFQELILRWFQFATFSPIFRNHGQRHPRVIDTNCGGAGGPNEIYTFQYYTQIKDLILLRNTLRGYIFNLGLEASNFGIPIIRPMFYNFPNCIECYTAQDQYMFGNDYLIAPIYKYLANNRTVYLPKLNSGENWKHYYTNIIYNGGQYYIIPTTINDFPLFVRDRSLVQRITDNNQPVMTV